MQNLDKEGFQENKRYLELRDSELFQIVIKLDYSAEGKIGNTNEGE